MITKKVEYILQNHPKARNSDKELLILFMQYSKMNLDPTQVEILRHLPSFETIRRVRQKLQENGKYASNDSIKRGRHHKSLVVQQNAPTASPETVERILEQETIL